MNQTPASILTILSPLPQSAKGRPAIPADANQESAPFAEAFALLLAAGRGSPPNLLGSTPSLAPEDGTIPLSASVADDVLAGEPVSDQASVNDLPVEIVTSLMTLAPTNDGSPLVEQPAEPTAGVPGEGSVPSQKDVAISTVAIPDSETMGDAPLPNPNPSGEASEGQLDIPISTTEQTDGTPPIDARLGTENAATIFVQEDAVRGEAATSLLSDATQSNATTPVKTDSQGAAVTRLAQAESDSMKASARAEKANLAAGTSKPNATEDLSLSVSKFEASISPKPPQQDNPEPASALAAQKADQLATSRATVVPAQHSEAVMMDAEPAAGKISLEVSTQPVTASRQSDSERANPPGQSQNNDAASLLKEGTGVSKPVQGTHATREDGSPAKPSKHARRDPAKSQTAQTAITEQVEVTVDAKPADTSAIETAGTNRYEAAASPRHVAATQSGSSGPAGEVASPMPSVEVKPFTIETPKPIQVPGQVRLRLDPPEWGYIRVDLTSSANGIIGTMRIRSEQTRDVIERNIGELRRSLAEAGVRVERFEIVGMTRPEARQSFQSNTPNQNQGEGQGMHRQSTHFGAADDRQKPRQQGDGYRRQAQVMTSFATALAGVNLVA